MGALVINVDKFPGGVAYLTDKMFDDVLFPRARRLGHDHVVCRIGGQNVPFKFLGETVMEVLLDGAGEYHSGNEGVVGAGPQESSRRK